MKQRFTKRTRLVSALLTLAMVFTFLPFSALAANTASTGIAFDSPDFALEFPDAEFQRFLRECCDKNNDGKLDVDIRNMTIPTSYRIKSLKGISFFEDLEKLDCHGIGLTTLNVGKNFKLEELDCSDNQLKESYPILSSGLKKLNCSKNKLTYMNLGILYGLNLEEVDCSNNEIRNIVMDSVGELVKFDCSNNDLMALDVSQCFKLEGLNCSGNQLMELDIGHQPQLTQLDCSKNKLTELNVKQNGNLTSLICNDNQLKSLDLSQNHSLSHLNCARNRLACVDVTGISGTITADGNRCPIAVRTDGTFDLNTLPEGFDINRVTGWEHGKANGNILTVDEGTNVVYYAYKCRSDILEVSFKLDVTGTGGTVPPVTPPEPPVTPSEPPVTPPSGGGDGGGAVVIVAAAGAVAAGVVGYGVYNYVSGRKLQALLPEGVAAPENRAQTALLLWNTAGRPEPAEAPAFADVADPDTAKAAQWCVEQGLMKRRLNGKFAPGSSIPAYQVLNAYRKLAGG